MTDLRKAAEMALEALERLDRWLALRYGSELTPPEQEVVKALRQALAQPEQGNSSPNYPITESNTSLDKIVEQAIQGHASTRDAIRWAMQQEREACPKVADQWDTAITDKVAEAIRARGENPPVKSYCGGKPNYCTPEVTPEVTGEVTGDVDAVNTSQKRVDETAKSKHEPVAWFVQYEYRHEFLWRKPNELEQKTALEIKPLYTAPPKREWVGLTEYQRLKFADRFHISEVVIEAIEAKLKEKNGG